VKITDASIFDAIGNQQIWAPWFRHLPGWRPWFCFLRVLFGLPLEEGDVEIFHECSGRTDVPEGRFSEAWLICGRRSGKSFILALVAVFLGVFRDWRPFLIPGERATIKVIAVDRRQARVIHRYARALLMEVPALTELVEADTEDEIELKNGLTIEIQTASFRTVRGYTVIAALCDEIAYWRSDEAAANPDDEILTALRPAMATVPGMMLAASSPYARRGALYKAHRRYWGQDGAQVLCWKAPTRTMNPTVPQQLIDDALAEDQSSAAAEWLAEFRTDIESYISREVVEALMIPGRKEVPLIVNTHYQAFVDMSGGRIDSSVLAIGHLEGQIGLLDVVREIVPDHDPAAAIAEFAAILKHYGITEITGDRYGGNFPPEQFRQWGVNYITSERTKSELYHEFLPLLNSRKVELLDHPKMLSQLVSLERRTGRGTGRESIDHPANGHDDVANAVAGCLVGIAGKPDIFDQAEKFALGLQHLLLNVVAPLERQWR
jgi:hypothetical protein